MAIDLTVRHAQDAQLGIRGETAFGSTIDADSDTDSIDSTAYRRIPMSTVTKPTFNVTRESRMLSGRGAMKETADTVLITKGGTVTCPFDFIATPELLAQHLVLAGQNDTYGSNKHLIKFGKATATQTIGGSVSGRQPHSVNLAYMPSAAGTVDGMRINGCVVSDLSIKGDYGNQSGCLTMSGNYYSGFSNPTISSGSDGVPHTQLEQNFDGTWTDPDQNTFIHMADLGTKKLDVDSTTLADMVIKSFEFNISNGITAFGGDGLGNPEGYTMPQLDVTGNLVIKHDANFEMASANNVLESFLTKDALTLQLYFGDGTVSALGEVNIVANIQISADPTLENTDAGVFWNIPFECMNTGATNGLEIEIYNTTDISAM